MGIVMAVCTSLKKGTQKENMGGIEILDGFGLKGDAHGGNWHRQVSLLSFEKIEEFRARGAQVEFGAFGENLVIRGYDFRRLPIGTRFVCNEVVLELTQIGKECHLGCAIYKTMGDCIMPREGVFCRVIHGGFIKVGDVFEIQHQTAAAMVLLAGGNSKRMGEDKAFLMLEGEVLWERIARELQACGPVYLSLSRSEHTGEASASGRLGEESSVFGYQIIRDQEIHIGPMGGIAAVMRAAKEELFFVSACDMPFMNGAFVELLLAQWEKHRLEAPDGLMVRNEEGRIYATAGLYHRRILPKIEERIANGNYRMMSLLRDSNICYLEEEQLPLCHQKALQNINTPKDYERLRKELPGQEQIRKEPDQMETRNV